MRGRCSIPVLAAALVLLSAEAATKHFSFSGGYPTTTSRQPSSATAGSFGASAATRSGAAKKAAEKTFAGTVVQVASGDVLWVTPAGGRRTKVKLADIDAPEQGQNFGVEAKKFLFDLVNGRQVTVRYCAKDRAGAIPGTVMLEHEKGLVDVNLTMLRNGCAWHVETPRPENVRINASQARAYDAAEKEAREAKRGLWTAPNPVNPAEWRKTHR